MSKICEIRDFVKSLLNSWNDWIGELGLCPWGTDRHTDEQDSQCGQWGRPYKKRHTCNRAMRVPNRRVVLPPTKVARPSVRL